MDKRMSWIVRIHVVILLFTLSVKGFSTEFNKELSDLHQELQAVPEDEYLVFLDDYSKKHIQDENYREILRFYEEEAIRLNDNHHLGNALALLGRYFYPDHTDSLFIMMERIKPILEETKEYKEYIELWALYNYSLVWEGKSEEMEESIKALKDLSIKMNIPKGLELADLNMAYFYFTNSMPEEAEKLYLNVLDRKIRRNAPLIERIGVLTQLFDYVSQDDPEKKEKYLQQAQDLIELFKKQPGNKDEDKATALIHEFTVHSSYATMLISEERYDEAMEHLKILEKIPTSQSFRDERLTLLNHLYFLYYYQQKQYDQALHYIEKVESLVAGSNNLSNRLVALNNKLKVYIFLGKADEAITLQSDIMELTDSINQADFQDRVADTRTRYEMEKLELEKQQIEIESEKTRSHVTLLIGGCFLLLLAVFGLIFVVRAFQKSKQAYKKAKEEAENADRMKSAFLANMNHEIRTPLNAIVGFSQLIIEEVDPENKHEFAQIIESNNELLQRLIGDVLDISKIESNSLSLIYKEYEVCQIMKELFNSMSLRMPETVELILDPCEVITIETDRNRLVQIITNLLTNAIKHTAEGSIRFGFKQQGTNTLYFYVQDTGEGIPPEKVDTVFDRFVQLENGTKGVGLGLAICKGLINQMGGHIGVTSVYGEGSTFYFTIPVRRDS